ncbi:unnamed protein product [Pocillopora meandrina]|uniref:Uncharacterized protein n=1 Tax=Pocillopora meandrina TaxID=46732 RepID=A0AAU9W081_9CNID|nr:unnamed protein product [Pocillopora meandrina]
MCFLHLEVYCAMCLVLKGITHCKTMFMVMKVVMAPVAKRMEKEAISKRKKKIFEKFFSSEGKQSESCQSGQYKQGQIARKQSRKRG